MKFKHLSSVLLVCVCLCLISWGYTGHRTIGAITETRLNPKAKAMIKNLLGDTSIADACTWADDARKDPQFKDTGNWHFLNLPLGLTFQDFKQYVDTIGKDNVYSALLNAERILKDPKSDRQQQVYSLKFLMHFVGDLHQPMHISRAEDKGGNTIQLNYEGKGTNLHSLWDTKMLENQGLSYAELAAKYAQISEVDAKQWQKDPLIVWVWESYQISSDLYAEVDAMGKRVVGQEYAQKHMMTVERRIKQASVRLAGLLNRIYQEK